MPVPWLYPRKALRVVRMTVVLVVGGSVVLIGVLMVFTPGPAIIVVPAGLGILATEFAWARRWLDKAKLAATAAAAKARSFGPSAFSGAKSRSAPPPADGNEPGPTG